MTVDSGARSRAAMLTASGGMASACPKRVPEDSLRQFRPFPCFPYSTTFLRR